MFIKNKSLLRFKMSSLLKIMNKVTNSTYNNKINIAIWINDVWYSDLRFNYRRFERERKETK